MAIVSKDTEKVLLITGGIVGAYLLFKAYSVVKQAGKTLAAIPKSVANIAAETYTAASNAVKKSLGLSFTPKLSFTPNEGTVANIKSQMPAAESIRGEALRDLEARRKAFMLENMSPLKLPATTITAFQAWWNEDKAAQEFFARKPDGVFYD